MQKHMLFSGIEEMKKPELVFIPLPVAGHLASTVQLAKLLVSRHEELSIRILLLKDGAENSGIKSIHTSETTKRIQFMKLSEPQPQANFSGRSEDPFVFLCEMTESYKPQVRDLVDKLKQSATSKLVGFVVDMFTMEMIDVADEFELPAYLFYTSGASPVGLWPFLQTLADENVDIRDYQAEFCVSTYGSPVPAKLLPATIFDKVGFAVCLKINARLTQTKGIMVNTFLDLEPHALRALASDQRMPPVYTIGPLINLTGINTKKPETEIIMRWLDAQPTSSVVFLCFGSRGAFDGDQVKEIAFAIERSGCRFLWSLRRAPLEDCKQYPDDYENFEEVLPEGFLDRTSGVGKVIGWAPQVQVLGHPAVGGFVTHCGWNSVLESVWFGVPMAAWPMYAEQQVNALLMVKDIGIAAEIQMDYNSERASTELVVVKSEKIEKAIRQLMLPESEIKKKVKELMGKARSAILKGGSSYISLENFMEDLLAVR